jgi:hypothetical protein
MKLNTDKLAKDLKGHNQTWGSVFGQPNAILFASQDSWYRLYCPTTNTIDNSFYVTLRMDHIVSNSGDDHAVVMLEFNQDGQLLSAELAQSSVGGDTLPIFEVATVLGTAAGLFTVAGSFLTATTALLSFTYRRLLDDADDGGRLNFPAVIVQTILKVAACIEQDQASPSPNAIIQFNPDLFVSSMGAATKYKNDHKSGIDFEATNFTYKTDNCDSHYRTWSPDSQEVINGIQKNGGGIVVSCKIDHIRGDDGSQPDDHIVLVLFFDNSCKLVNGEAILSIHGEDASSTGMVSAGSPNSGDTVSGRLYAKLLSRLQPSYGSSNDGRQHFPGVAKKNIEAICASIVR